MSDKIAVIGLGYVGLPLAVAFANDNQVLGYDKSEKRIEGLNRYHDHTGEVDEKDLDAVRASLRFTTVLEEIRGCNIYIITVPTPVDRHNNPDLTPLLSASAAVGSLLNKGDLVIYESTVYPGCTEEDCVPQLEEASGLVYNKDFFCGYSPERINPGDKERTLRKIKKVTSGSNEETAKKVDDLYNSIVDAGTHRASSIKVAEASKVIENSQRDLNIAFVNELALIFNRMGIDTNEVLDAAGTKWNFLKFKPGLVGGHCIGVDPYYLTYKAQTLGYIPQVILAGRRINDNMGRHIAERLVKLMIRKGNTIKDARVLILGITFKENCSDIRNTRVVDMVKELREYGCRIDIYDPWADADEVSEEFGLEILTSEPTGISYDGLIGAVAHKEFQAIKPADFIGDLGVVYDVKHIFSADESDERL